MDLDARYTPAVLDALLPALRFRPDDAADLRASASAVLADADARARLSDGIARLEASVPSLTVPTITDLDPEDRWGRGVIATLALVGSVETAITRKQQRGLNRAEALAALADLGQQLWVDRRTFGRYGLHNEYWVAMNWAGPFCWFGRLQAGVEAMPHDVPGHPQGEPACFLHIPELGPLDPAAVDASLAELRARQAALFPEVNDPAIYCETWLLDPVVRALAGPDSRIAAFADRFTDLVPTRSGDRDAVYFVFRREGFHREGFPDVDLSTLPRTTRLERGLLEYFEAGHTLRLNIGRIKEDA